MKKKNHEEALEIIELADLNTGEIIEAESINETSDKSIVVSNFREIVASVMSEAQFSIMSGRTPRNVIRKRPGKGGKTFSYVPHGYVASTLNKAFGFDWDYRSLPFGNGDYYKLIPEDAGMRPASIVVQSELTIRIRNPKDIMQVVATIVKQATGEKEVMKGMTWGSHIKAAEADGFKKCASKLGIALDLYYNDSEEDAVNGNGAEVAQQPLDALTVRAREMKASGSSLGAIAKELGESIPAIAKRLK